MITKRVFVDSEYVNCIDEYAESWNAMYELSMADVVNIKKYMKKKDSEVASYHLYMTGLVVLFQGEDFENPDETLRLGGTEIIVYSGSAYIEACCKYTGTKYEFEIKL